MRLLLALLILSFSAFPATAQEYSFEQYANYTRLSLQAMKMPNHFNFYAFRIFYTQTEQFAPISEDVKKTLMNYAHAAGNDPNPQKREDAARAFQTLATKHLANIDVVTMAGMLSRENPRLGSARVFEWLRKGLLESVKTSGSGDDLYHAYSVVTLGEETALLRELKLTLIKTDSHHEAADYYNVHHVKNSKGEQREVYINLSIPLKILSDREEAARQALQMPVR